MVIIGHSFVRRLRDHLFTPRSSHGRPRGQDISFCHNTKAQLCAQKLGVSNNIRAVYTSGNDINLIADLHKSESLIHEIQPQIIVIDIGSNDIANIDHENHNIMLEFANRLIDFALALTAPLIIINSVLPRTERISSTPDQFRNNASHFNKFISVYVSDTSNIIYNKMRGFAYYYDANNKESPKPVHMWSQDGIHCDERSIQQYRNRIRHAILDNIHRLKDKEQSQYNHSLSSYSSQPTDIFVIQTHSKR